jgi:hypothetical protein
MKPQVSDLGMDTFLMEQADRDTLTREEDKHNARLVVAGAARDTQDCLMLLQALGLIEQT